MGNMFSGSSGSSAGSTGGTAASDSLADQNSQNAGTNAQSEKKSSTPSPFVKGGMSAQALQALQQNQMTANNFWN